MTVDKSNAGNNANVGDININSINTEPATNPTEGTKPKKEGDDNTPSDGQDPTPPNPNPNPAGDAPTGDGNKPGADPSKKDEGADGNKPSGDDDAFSIFEDDNGNFVDKDGKIIVKKEDAQFDNDGNLLLPDNLVGPTIADSVQQKLINDYGFNFTDADGKPKVYEDTEAGISEMVADAVKQGVAQQQQNLFEQYPDLKYFLNHLVAGQNPASYFATESKWQNYKLPDANDTSEQSKAIRKNVIFENFKMQFGYNEANENERPMIEKRARDYADMMEDAGKLDVEASTHLKDLQNREKATIEARNKANEDAIKTEQANSAKYWNTVSETVKSGDLKGLNIPAAERQAFLDYVSKDVTGKGTTQEMLDMEKEDVAYGLQLAYMRFKKFNLDDLVKVKAVQHQAAKLSERKAKFKVVSNDSPRSGQRGQVSISDIKLSKLL